MSIDRRAVTADLLTLLGGSGLPIDLGKRPDGAGDTPAGFVVYGILWPLNASPTDLLTAHDAGDNGVWQVTSVADDPDLAMRVSHQFKAHLAANTPATLGGRQVSRITFPFESGPHRDPEDDRLFSALLQPRVETWG